MGTTKETTSNITTTTASSLSQVQMKMATLPENCELRFNDYEKKISQWPILQCQNIYILPGVPQFFKQKINSIVTFLSSSSSNNDTTNDNKKNITQSSSSYCCFKVLLTVEEHIIVSPLNKVVKRHPNVTFGSYPFFNNTDEEWKTIVTLESNIESNNVITTAFSSSSSLKDDDNDNNDDGSISIISNSTIATSSLLMNGKNNNNITTKNQLIKQQFTKEEMELNLKLALSDFLMELPDGSVLRVENDDNLIIT